ncbi:hypothetical protein POJ06DRAFT_240128 [Lipomyces tetrasporus]|uniref:Uncharacterized protein n=1 Tax=Lipomyces tetrasporus TaxID=54092 RepID=A0AAD7VQR8_9ASCO|nr:uncharacterized protein POJ06DRAFT_240128 [Lipomyces tetrasporus]KAJ8098423.1 hypothetical protein POJ06DRAFT_240128 [Lipomyces tetrasporus]
MPVKAVTEYTKSYTTGSSPSILKYVVSFDEDGYTDDFAAMVDESVNLGDVTELHMKYVAGALGAWRMFWSRTARVARDLGGSIWSRGSSQTFSIAILASHPGGGNYVGLISQRRFLTGTNSSSKRNYSLR